jgi:hypothetical protein
MSKCIVIRKYLPVAIGLAAFAVIGTAPALAAAHHRTVHRRVARSSYASEHGGAPYSSSAWQTTQFAAYASCMMDHGQRVQ